MAQNLGLIVRIAVFVVKRYFVIGISASSYHNLICPFVLFINCVPLMFAKVLCFSPFGKVNIRVTVL